MRETVATLAQSLAAGRRAGLESALRQVCPRRSPRATAPGPPGLLRGSPLDRWFVRAPRSADCEATRLPTAAGGRDRIWRRYSRLHQFSGFGRGGQGEPTFAASSSSFDSVILSGARRIASVILSGAKRIATVIVSRAKRIATVIVSRATRIASVILSGARS